MILLFVLFAILMSASIVVLIIGLIKPEIVLRGGTRKKATLVYGLATILFFIGVVSTSYSLTGNLIIQPKKEVAAKTQEEIVKPQLVKKQPQEILEYTFIDEFEKNLIDVTVNKYTGNDPAGKDKYVVQAKLKAKKGWDAKNAMKSTLYMIKDELDDVFEKHRDIYEITFFIETTLVDTNGNESNGLWAKLHLKGEDGEKINYDRISIGKFANFLEFTGGTDEARTIFNEIKNE